MDKIKRNKINNIKKPINNNPKISVIIPIFNSEKTIELTIKSVHFQNLKELEIILINDHSLDNSSYIIEQLKRFDQRINIINNLQNMGTLYSRSIGALNAKGEYIIGLDNDDLFLSEDILETLYLYAKNNYFDIIEIKSFNIPHYNPRFENIKNGDFIYHPNNLILHQPELGRFAISYKNKLNFTDHFVWGKFINAKIYKNAINKLGIQRYSQYNCWTEDIIFVFVLFNIANSFIFLNIFGVFHVIDKSTTTYKLSNEHKFLSSIFFLGIIYDFSKNESNSKNYVAQYALHFSSDKINKLDKENKLYFFSIIKNIINCKYISVEYKKKIAKKFY